MVYRESITHQLSIIRPGQCTDKVDMELLQGICVEVSNPLCCNASTKAALSSLSEQSLNFFAAILLNTSSIGQISNKFLGLIKHKEDIWFSLKLPLSFLKEIAAQINDQLLYCIGVRYRNTG